MGLPLRNSKEDRTTTNKTGFSNNSSRSMSSPSFIEFGRPPFPRSNTLSQSGPLNALKLPPIVKFQRYVILGITVSIILGARDNWHGILRIRDN